MEWLGEVSGQHGYTYQVKLLMRILGFSGVVEVGKKLRNSEEN